MDVTGLLAQRLLWARREQGITLQQLSERSGRAVSYLSQLEHGVKTNPTKQTVEALAAALGVRPAFLFADAAPAAGSWPDLGRQFRQHIESLPHARQQAITCDEAVGRFATVLRFLLDTHPESFTRVELAYRLGMSLGQFDDILHTRVDISLFYMEQLAQLTGVPLSFLTHGSFDPVPVPDDMVTLARQYIRALQLASQYRLTPERLEAIIAAAQGK